MDYEPQELPPLPLDAVSQMMYDQQFLAMSRNKIPYGKFQGDEIFDRIQTDRIAMILLKDMPDPNCRICVMFSRWLNQFFIHDIC